MEKPDKILKKVAKHISASQFTEAMYALQDALMEDGRSEPLLWKLVEVYGFMKDDVNAVNTIRKIIANDPSSATKVVVLKFLQTEFPTFFPRSKHADMLEFEINIERKDIIKAVEAFRRILHQDAMNIVQGYTDKLDKLKKINGDAAAIRDNIFLCYQIFGGYYTHEKYDEAFDMLAQIASASANEVPIIEKMLLNLEVKDASNPYLFFYLGKIYLDQKKLPLSMEKFKKGIEANSALAQFVLPLCEPLFESMQKDAAFVRFFAMLHYYCGQYEKAFSYFDLFLTLDNSEAAFNSLKEIYDDIYIKVGGKTFVLIAMVKFLSQMNDYENAMRKFLQIRAYDNPEIETTALMLLEHVKEKTDLHKMLAEFYVARGDVDKAVHFLGDLFASDQGYADFITEKLKKMDVKDNKEYLKLLGDISVYRNDLKDAFTFYKQLEEAFPEEVDVIIAGYENLLAKSEKSVRLRQMLVEMYMRYKHYKKALKMLGEVLMMDVTLFASVYLHFNTIAEQEPEMIDKIKGLLEILQKKTPTNPYIQFNLGFLGYCVNSVDTVVQWFEPVMQSSDEDLLKHVTEVYFKLQEKNPHDVQLRWVINDILLSSGRFHDLISSLNALYLDFPAENRRILAALQIVFEKEYDDDDIIRLFSKIAFEQQLLDDLARFIAAIDQKKPHSSALYYARAELNFKKGNIKEVVKDFQKLVKYGTSEDIAASIRIAEEVKALVKPNPGVYYILGSLYQKNGANTAALELYKKVIGIERDKDELIEKLLDEMIIAVPNDPQPRILRGMVCMKYERYDDAIVFFNQALQLDVSAADAVLEKYEEIIRKNPARVDFQMELARLYANVQRPAESYTLLAAIEPAEEMYVRYLQTLKVLTEQCSGYSQGHRLLAEFLWKSEKFAECEAPTATVIALADTADCARIVSLMTEKVFDIHRQSLAELYCNAVFISGTTTDIIHACSRYLEVFKDAAAPYLDGVLGQKTQDPELADLVLKISLLLEKYEKAYEVIQQHYSRFLQDPDTLLTSLQSIFEARIDNETIFSMYVAAMIELRKHDLLIEELSRVEALPFAAEHKAKYLLLLAEMYSHSDKDKVREIYRSARALIPDMKTLYRISKESANTAINAWLGYYETIHTDDSLLHRARLYIRQGSLEKAYATLITISAKTHLREKQLLTIAYYFTLSDYASVLNAAETIEFIPWDMNNNDCDCVRMILRAARALRMFATARAYLGLLKRYISHDEYMQIMQLIQREEVMCNREIIGLTVTY